MRREWMNCKLWLGTALGFYLTRSGHGGWDG